MMDDRAKLMEALGLIVDKMSDKSKSEVLAIIDPDPAPKPDYVPLDVETIKVEGGEIRFGNSYGDLYDNELPDAHNLVHMVKIGMRAVEKLPKAIHLIRINGHSERANALQEILDDLKAGPKLL